MTAAPEAALLESFERRREQRWEEQVVLLGAQGVAWLALFPEWTVNLAEKAGFPTGSLGDVERWVRAAQDAGLCQCGPPVDYLTDPSVRFSMTDNVRARVVARLRVSRADLPRTTLDIVDAVVAAAAGAASLTPSQEVWLDLARHGSPSQSAGFLLTQLRQFLDEGRTADLNAWIAAAERLEPTAGAEMASAVRRGKRLVALHYRRLHDEQVLEDYLVVPDQVAAFDRLLASDAIWALHYIGQGGAGKTSLLRHLMTRTGAVGAGPTFARVDFDYVSAEYPWKRPGQLLVELADELDIAVVEGEAERSSRTFRASEVRSAEALSGTATLELAPDSVEMNAAYDAFADLVQRLPQPVVLILDTCEELAKFHPPGAKVESVDFTFDILERIHERVPALRVVFAGRRFLADGGAPTPGWAGYDPDHALAVTAARPYLDLFEIQGFTTEEARSYLRRASPSLAPAVVDAILAASSDTGGTPGLIQPSSERRHNPFEVALYARWSHDDDLLSPNLIGGDKGFRYVESRIVARLEPELREGLRPVVALGRFGADLLELAVGSRELAERLFERLRHQEWTDVSTDRSGTVIQVKPSMLIKLRHYLERVDGAVSGGGAQPVLGPLAERLPGYLRHAPLVELGPSTIRAALSTIPVAEAVALWTDIEQRFRAERAWPVAERTCASLLAADDDGGIPADRPLVRAAVAATTASAATHLGHDPSAPPLWTMVLDSLAPAPEASQTADRLRRRAQLGLARSAVLDDAVSLVLEGTSGVDLGDDPELAAALCAPLEHILDAACLVHADLAVLGPLVARILRRAGTGDDHATDWSRWEASSDVDVELLTLAARWIQEQAPPAGGRPTRSADAAPPSRLFRAAERAAAPHAGAGREWLDRRARTNLVDHCRLVWLWSGVRVGTPAERASSSVGTTLDRLADPVIGSYEWPTDALDRLDQPDGAAFVSLLLAAELTRGTPDPVRLASVASGEVYVRRHAPGLVRSTIPPLFVSVARAHHALGHTDTALELLYRRADEAALSRNDPETVGWADRAVVALSRLERRDPGSLLDRLALDADGSTGHEAKVARMVIGPSGSDTGHMVALHARLDAAGRDAVELHRLWQLAASRDGDEQAAFAGTWLTKVAQLAPTDRATAELRLDEVEAGRWKGHGPPPPPPGAGHRAMAEGDLGDGLPEHAIRGNRPLGGVDGGEEVLWRERECTRSASVP